MKRNTQMRGLSTPVRLTLLVAAALAGPPPAAGQAYDLIDLGGGLGEAYSGGLSFAVDINQSGHVVGFIHATDCCQNAYGFLWRDGVMIDLGAVYWVPGLTINDAGQVAGRGPFPSPSHLFLWQDGVVTDLGALPGREWSSPHDMNELGQVVGYSGWFGQGQPPKRLFLWLPAPAYGLPAGMNDLGTAGDDSFVLRINDAGQVVGTGAPGRRGEGFLWQDGVLTDLGEFGWARALNNAGQVVGYWTNRDDLDQDGIPNRHAVIWHDGVMINLSAFGVRAGAYAINDSGQVVGTQGDCAFLVTPEDANGDGAPDTWFRDDDGDGANDLMIDLCPLRVASSVHLRINNVGQVAGLIDGTDHAFLWDNGRLIDLNDLLPPRSGWLLERDGVFDINDAGQIVGVGTFEGRLRAFLLTPIPDADPDGDGVLGTDDNCPEAANADQADADGDGVGDVCDACEGYDDRADCDLDGKPDGCAIAEGAVPDCNANGIPDACETATSDERRFVLYESFEDDAFPPEGWSTLIVQGPDTWQKISDPQDAFIGTGAAVHPWEPSAAEFDTWLLSPELDTPDAELSFFTMGCFDQPWCPNYTVNVFIVVGEPGGEDDVLVGSLNELWTNNFAFYVQGVAELTPDLPDGPFRIGFHYRGMDAAEAFIDEVVISRLPDPAPNDQNRNRVPDECERGDLDGDGDVDLSDLLAFQSCFSGAGRAVSPGCEDADLDNDGDTDLADLVALQARFTGTR